jgi:hypothetical protein
MFPPPICFLKLVPANNGMAGGPLQPGSTAGLSFNMERITGGAPLLTIFEKWPAKLPTPEWTPSYAPRRIDSLAYGGDRLDDRLP